MRHLAVLLGSAFVLASAAAVQATTVVVTLGQLNTPGSAYGTDLDSAGPVAGGGGSGYGTSSFGGSVNPAGPVKYTTFRVDLAAALGHTVTVGDLDAFSYRSDTAGTIDWRPSIYTKKQLGDSKFYHSRIQATPLPDGLPGWGDQTTGGLSFYESNLLGGSQTGIWTWSEIQNGTNSLRDFRGEEIQFIDFTLGANSGGGTEAGNLDGVSFTVGAENLTLDLEATSAVVPLPGAFLAGSALLSSLGLRRNRAAV